MGNMIREALVEFIEYKTPKIVHIKNKKIGIINRVIQLAILVYVIAFAIVYKRGYQEFSNIESSVTVKVKGTLSTKHFLDSDFDSRLDKSRIPYYKKTWDIADYNVPSSDTESFFIMTNVVITPNQTQSTCPEDPEVKESFCASKNDCLEGQILPLGNGPQTGECSNSKLGENRSLDPENRFLDSNSTSANGTCIIESWCPLEDDILPMADKSKPLLVASENFTVLIKNTVEFLSYPKIGKLRNILSTQNKTFLSSCTYADEDSNGKSNLCPIFMLGDIIDKTGNTYSDIGIKGGVISININWDCNFDYDIKYCQPQYSFSRLDQANASISPGMNFRYANYYSDDNRTLFKAYGIRFVVTTTGRGGKFNFVPLLINVGSGLGLMAITTIICDFIAFYFTRGKEYYREKKFLYVNEMGSSYEVNNSEHSSIYSTPNCERRTPNHMTDNNSTPIITRRYSLPSS